MTPKKMQKKGTRRISILLSAKDFAAISRAAKFVKQSKSTFCAIACLAQAAGINS